MTMDDAVRPKARDWLTGVFVRIQRLRATGPNPFDYWIWADETHQGLQTIYGRAADEPLGFAAIVYERGRTIDQRGSYDNMTLNVHGEWGIRARLDRAEVYLNTLGESLGGTRARPAGEGDELGMGSTRVGI